MGEALKLSYNASLLRVRVELTRAICLAQETPPTDVVLRAKAKMESVKASGESAFYLVYEKRFQDAWKAMREIPDGVIENNKIVLTLAAAAPALAGVKIEKASSDKGVAMLSIDAPMDAVKTWQYEWFKLFVVRKIRDLGITEYVNNAQLHGCFLRVKGGEKVANSLLGAMPKMPPAAGARSFSILANKARREIAVLIRDFKELMSREGRDQMLNQINLAVRQLGTDGVQYKVLKQEFIAALQNAMSGPEILGLDLPLVILAAMGHQVGAKEGPASALAPMQAYPGMGNLNVRVSADRMEVTVSEFNLALYDDPSFEVNLEWIELELKRNGIRVGISDDLRKSLSEVLTRRETLAGKTVAVGVPGVGGKGPRLHKSYKEADARTQGDLEQGNLDIREMQQRAIVTTGQLVAEIRYSEEAIPGRNVLGEEIPSPKNDELVIHVGEGIQQRGMKFFATVDGLPTIEGENISLSKVLMHNGDVNLRTGNIRFDGPVEIRGSIDSGAIVETTGDLVVHGTIRGGFVKAGGSITVKSGIVTGITGRVQARTDLIAEFIENSNIVCGGNLIVSKAIISSQVICGGSIKTLTSQTGVIAGGRISCKDKLVTQNLGFKRGAVTTLNIGVDWRIAQAVDIRRGRLEKVQKKLGEDRQTLREIVQRNKAQLTPRHIEMKEELTEKLARGRLLVEKLEAKLAEVQAKLTYNSESKILVTEILAANVHITIGGQVVAIANDVAGVGVLPKRRRGSFIVAIEEMGGDEDLNSKAS